MNRPFKPTPGVEPGTSRLRIGGSTTELSRRNSDAVLDPKPCPKRASDVAETKPRKRGDDNSFRATTYTSEHESHSRVLNRRPLLSHKVAFRGISRQVNDITRSFTAFFGRKVVKSHPETVPKPCLTAVGFPDHHTNLPRDPFKYEGRDLTDEQFAAAVRGRQGDPPSIYDAPLHLLTPIWRWTT